MGEFTFIRKEKRSHLQTTHFLELLVSQHNENKNHTYVKVYKDSIIAK